MSNTMFPKEEEKNYIKEREQRLESVLRFNLLSDTFMSLCLKDKGACEHVLRTLTGVSDLNVKEVRTQERMVKLASHDAILDVFAEDSKGQFYNIEIQRSSSVDHAKRTRFYGAMIDSEMLAKGKTYAELPDVYIIYISEKDIWKAGHTSYAVKKYFENTNMRYDDGKYVIYVNAEVDDGTETAKLMQYFKTANPEDQSQGALSERVRYLKDAEGGHEEMCEITDEIFREGQAAGKVEGKIEQAQETVVAMHQKGFDDATIADILQVSLEQVREWLPKAGN